MAGIWANLGSDLNCAGAHMLMFAYMPDSQYNKNFNLLQNFQPITEKRTSSKTRTLVEIVVEGQNFRRTDFPTDYYAKF